MLIRVRSPSRSCYFPARVDFTDAAARIEAGETTARGVEFKPGEDVGILRALDELRLERPLGAALVRLRDLLVGRIGPGAITYQLELHLTDGGVDRSQVFFSYSGPYTAGERLPLLPEGDCWEVVEVHPAGEADPGGSETLICRPCLVGEAQGVPAVTFDFGETTRSLPGEVAAVIAERLLARTKEAKAEVAYQVAISIQARLDGTTERAIPMTVKEERDELWEIVNPLRSERTGDQWLDLLWQALFSARLHDHDPIELIRTELVRIGAGADAVGPQDAIYVQDRGQGFASLEGSAAATDIGWHGTATDILKRLSNLPDRGGPEAVRSEFSIQPVPVYRVLIDRIGGAEAEGWYDYLLRAFGGDPGLLDTDPDADLQPSTP